MLRLFRTESPYSSPQMFRLGLCEKIYLNTKTFTNALFYCECDLNESLNSLSLAWQSMSMLFSLTRLLNSNFRTSIPVELIWEGTESKRNKSDTRLVIFVSKFFKRQKFRRFFFFNFQVHCRGWSSFATVCARKHATYRTCFLKTKNVIPGKIWSVMALLR